VKSTDRRKKAATENSDRPTWPEDKESQFLKRIFFGGRPLPMVVEPPALDLDSKGEET
jgi:hypothetical protein